MKKSALDLIAALPNSSRITSSASSVVAIPNLKLKLNKKNDQSLSKIVKVQNKPSARSAMDINSESNRSTISRNVGNSLNTSHHTYDEALPNLGGKRRVHVNGVLMLDNFYELKEF